MIFDLGGVDRLVLPDVDSTNAELLRHIEDDLDIPLWLLAHRQTKGRGRRGRAWTAPEGNLNASIAFEPKLAPARAALFSFVASLAVADLFTALAPQAEATLKWPNDALLNGHKVAGILLETAGTDSASNWLIVGIGVNLLHHPEGIERERDAPAISSVVTEGGREARAEEALDILAPAFERRAEVFIEKGFAPIRDEWLARAARLGDTIQAKLPRETVIGLFEDVDAEGQLVLRTADGVRRIAAADIHFPE